jgi:hypothetical protein
VTAPLEPVFARYTWRALLVVTVFVIGMGAAMAV